MNGGKWTPLLLRVEIATAFWGDVCPRFLPCSVVLRIVRLLGKMGVKMVTALPCRAADIGKLLGEAGLGCSPLAELKIRPRWSGHISAPPQISFRLVAILH